MIFDPERYNFKLNNKENSSAELFAGFFTALMVNGLLFWLSQETPNWNLTSSLREYINVLPWVVNGLFLLVFLLILPRFALGYLIGIASLLGVPLLVGAIVLAGCFLLFAAASLGDSLGRVSGWSFYWLIIPIIIGVVIILGLLMVSKRSKEDD